VKKEQEDMFGNRSDIEFGPSPIDWRATVFAFLKYVLGTFFAQFVVYRMLPGPALPLRRVFWIFLLFAFFLALLSSGIRRQKNAAE
jgi:hypothetical protein